MEYISLLLKGFSEVLFLESPLAGVFIAIAIGIVSPISLLFAIIGNIAASITGNSLGQKQLVEAGVYGFNGVLLGTAVGYYIKDNLALSLIIVLGGSIIAAILFYVISKFHIPPLALPYVMVTFGMLILLKYFHIN